MPLRSAQVCTAVNAKPLTWTVRVLWILLPLTLGGLLGDAAATGDGATAQTAVAWAVWAIGLFASFVQLPAALVLLRVVVPLPLVGGVVAAFTETPEPLGWAGLANAAAVAVVAMSAVVGGDFINGSSYGDEHRMSLRMPTALLLGPIEAVWFCTSVPLPLAMSVLGRGQWVGGGVLLVVGAVLAFAGFKALSRLARRWVVLVPAGLTIVDPMALAEPVLLKRTAIGRLGPAPVDTDAMDLTIGAGGLIIQADLNEPVELVRAVTRRAGVGTPVEANSILVAPTRPGELLALAEERRIAVDRT